MEPIKLTRKLAKTILGLTFPDYIGRKIKLVFKGEITFHDVNWGGGTRNYYKFLRSDGATVGLPDAAPWDNPAERFTVGIPNDVLVVVHSFFCGQDMGVTIYASPAHLPKWLEGG